MARGNLFFLSYSYKTQDRSFKTGSNLQWRQNIHMPPFGLWDVHHATLYCLLFALPLSLVGPWQLQALLPWLFPTDNVRVQWNQEIATHSSTFPFIPVTFSCTFPCIFIQQLRKNRSKDWDCLQYTRHRFKTVTYINLII